MAKFVNRDGELNYPAIVRTAIIGVVAVIALLIVNPISFIGPDSTGVLVVAGEA